MAVESAYISARYISLTLSHVKGLDTGFGLLIGCIELVKYVTVVNYSTVTNLHILQFITSCTVFSLACSSSWLHMAFTLCHPLCLAFNSEVSASLISELTNHRFQFPVYSLSTDQPENSLSMVSLWLCIVGRRLSPSLNHLGCLSLTQIHSKARAM
jgi:hypothetical protein